MISSQTEIIENTKSVIGNSKKRFGVFYILLISAVGALFMRTFYLQVIKGDEFRSAAENNRVAAIPIIAPRGIIYDKNGIQLVVNAASVDLLINPVELPPREHEERLIETLPIILNISREEVAKVINQARHTQRTTRLVAAIDHDTVLAIEQKITELPGVILRSSLVRQYPFENTTAHVIGYASLVNAQELENKSDLLPIDITGKSGIEQQYDNLLRGQHGVTYAEVDAVGRAIKQIDHQEPTSGSGLILSIDIALQEKIYDLFREKEKEGGHNMSGAVVAIDPRSGAVRALVSYPAFNPNTFSIPSLASLSSATVEDKRQPLFNRAITGTFPPGSTIKPLLAIAALNEHIITPATSIFSAGGISVGPWYFPDWLAGGHGATNVSKAIADSVNTFFYAITGGYGEIDGLGPEKTISYLKLFNWGSPTGIDLPNEAAGFLPSAAWKESVKKENWYIGDTYHLAIGQGDVLATPLQIALGTATIANGGILHQPELVQAINQPDKQSQQIYPTTTEVSIDPVHIDTVRQAMRLGVTEGSGRRLSLLSIPLAGKTGTAQIGGTKDTHAWYTSFGPYEEPELALTVLLEKGGAGDKQAVPFAQEIWQWWIDNRQTTS